MLQYSFSIEITNFNVFHCYLARFWNFIGYENLFTQQLMRLKTWYPQRFRRLKLSLQALHSNFKQFHESFERKAHPRFSYWKSNIVFKSSYVQFTLNLSIGVVQIPFPQSQSSFEEGIIGQDCCSQQVGLTLQHYLFIKLSFH
jgi:hypothetical protein